MSDFLGVSCTLNQNQKFLRSPLPSHITYLESTSQTLVCLCCHSRTHQLSVYCQTAEFTVCASFETLGGRVSVVAGIILRLWNVLPSPSLLSLGFLRGETHTITYKYKQELWKQKKIASHQVCSYVFIIHLCFSRHCFLLCFWLMCFFFSPNNLSLLIQNFASLSALKLCFNVLFIVRSHCFQGYQTARKNSETNKIKK